MYTKLKKAKQYFYAISLDYDETGIIIITTNIDYIMCDFFLEESVLDAHIKTIIYEVENTDIEYFMVLEYLHEIMEICIEFENYEIANSMKYIISKLSDGVSF